VSALWIAYRLIAPSIGAIAPAAVIFASPEERRLWSERMGRVSLAGGCDAWVHAASMGEAQAAGPLARSLLELAPDARLWLTAQTRTGRARLAELGLPVSLAPIDSPQAVARFFAGVAPRLVLIVETELWPHWLLHARLARVPVVIASARLAERSVRSYRVLGNGLRSLLAGLAGVLCQGEDDARRWRALGSPAERTVVVGNLKNDALPHRAPSVSEARLALGLDPARPLFVLGSLRPGEARLVARAWLEVPEALRRAWQVVAVPRHPRASAELASEARDAGQPVAPRDPEAAAGNGARGATDHATGAWRWDDRSGVLNAYYAAADLAFVGGSLLAYGGHNPLEPAAAGAAVVIGPHHPTQADAVRALAKERGVRIAASGAELADALTTLLGDADERARQAEAGRRVAEEMRGAARRAVAQLAAWKLWPPA
jgi:3-deoxy-D-manno-octulosonic-acid transferase